MKLIKAKRKFIKKINGELSSTPIPLVLLFGEVILLNKFDVAVKKRRRVKSLKFHTTDMLVKNKTKLVTRI